ncbi:MAG: polysaccharide biosynthesis/export family protein [Candidatus Acidiferrales bacterium]
MKILGRAVLFVLFLAMCTHAGDDLQHRPRYKLRVGDVLDVEYVYTPELNQTVTVPPDGYISLDMVGDVKVSDLTLDEAHDMIVRKASERLNAPEVNLVLQQFQPPYVVVAGEVGKPGQIDFTGNLTAMQAILVSGGFLESARATQVVLFRKIDGDNAEVRVLNLKNIRKTTDLERDVQLQPGDMLYVPRNKIQNVARFVKAFNSGAYVNPLQTLH